MQQPQIRTPCTFKDEYEALDNRLMQIFISSGFCSGLQEHSICHAYRVAYMAAMLAADIQISNDQMHESFLADVMIAAYFHDIGRVHDNNDNLHGKRSSEKIREIAKTEFPYADICSIAFAVDNHCMKTAPSGGPNTIGNYHPGEVPGGINLHVASCLWDADRLDLLRYHEKGHIIIRTENLSSGFAKRIANTEEHLDLLNIIQSRYLEKMYSCQRPQAAYH